MDKIILQDNVDAMVEMSKKFPWLKKCIKSIYLTEIGESYNLQYAFEETVDLEKDIEVKSNRKNTEWKKEFERSNKTVDEEYMF